MFQKLIPFWKYLETFEKYYLGDFHEFLDKDYYEANKARIYKYVLYGIKPVVEWLLGVIKYYSVKYCIINDPRVYVDIPSQLLREQEFKVYNIDIMTETFNKKWYEGIIKFMMEAYYDYHRKGKMIYIIFFICLAIIVVLYYSFIWKIYEERLNILLKRSANLINLIPQEIKSIIIEKLNE